MGEISSKGCQHGFLRDLHNSKVGWKQMCFWEREYPASKSQKNQGSLLRDPVVELKCGAPWMMKLQGLTLGHGICLTKFSRLQYVDSGTYLKVLKQGNDTTHLALLINHSCRCVDWYLAFQDRWLEMTIQIGDGKALTSSRWAQMARTFIAFLLCSRHWARCF